MKQTSMNFNVFWDAVTSTLAEVIDVSEVYLLQSSER